MSPLNLNIQANPLCYLKFQDALISMIALLNFHPLDGSPESWSISQYGLYLSHLKLQRLASHARYTDDRCNIGGGLGMLAHDSFTLRSRLMKQLIPGTLQVALAKEENSTGFCTRKLHFLTWK